MPERRPRVPPGVAVLVALWLLAVFGPLRSPVFLLYLGAVTAGARSLWVAGGAVLLAGLASGVLARARPPATPAHWAAAWLFVPPLAPVAWGLLRAGTCRGTQPAACAWDAPGAWLLALEVGVALVVLWLGRLGAARRTVLALVAVWLMQATATFATMAVFDLWP